MNSTNSTHDPVFTGTPEQQAALIAALKDFRIHCPVVTKDKTGRAGNRTYQYAALGTVYEVVNPILAEFGLTYVAPPFVDSSVTPHLYGCAATICHVGGATMVSRLAFPVSDPDPKIMGQILTYIARYALVNSLGIATEDDTDGETKSGESKAPGGAPGRPGGHEKSSAPPTTQKAEKSSPAQVPARQAPVEDPPWAEGTGKAQFQADPVTATSDTIELIRAGVSQSNNPETTKLAISKFCQDNFGMNFSLLAAVAGDPTARNVPHVSAPARNVFISKQQAVMMVFQYGEKNFGFTPF